MAIQHQHRYLVMTMVRRLSSFRGAHVVMWSSPLLLLVLLFTLTATAKSSTHFVTVRVHSTVTVVRTQYVTRSRSEPPPSTHARPPKRRLVTPSTALAASSLKTPYVSSITSIAKSPALAPNASVSSDVMTGVLSPALSVADVPLVGPGTWTLLSSTLIGAQLQCPSTSSMAGNRMVIVGAQRCQLQLTSTNPEVSATWQLTPVH